ncbi:hypothetical protein GCM10010245_10930 [Streptomyces spectabilis]|nr:hypothetical protein GCM10010245_10930 [Streptomyces spectabilis]
MTTERAHARGARRGRTGHVATRAWEPRERREGVYSARELREKGSRRALSRSRVVLRYVRTEPTTLSTAASPGRQESWSCYGECAPLT